MIPLARAIYIDDVAAMQDGPTIWQKLLRRVGYYLGATAITFCAVSASAQLWLVVEIFTRAMALSFGRLLRCIVLRDCNVTTSYYHCQAPQKFFEITTLLSLLADVGIRAVMTLSSHVTVQAAPY